MKKIYLIIAMLASMLVLAGCASEGGSENENSFGTAFNGGDRGLSYEFAQGAPPDRIRDGGLQPFQIRVRVQNEGEYDVPEGEGHVTLTGFSPGDLGLTQEETSQALPALRGVKKQGSNVVDGGTHQVLFSNLRYEAELPSGTLQQSIYANFCYPYKTKSLATLCIAGDTLRSYEGESTICDLEGEKAFSNSGAPVKIENVEQFVAGASSIQIQFDIVHQRTEDEGRLFKDNSLDNNCRVNGNSASSSEADLLANYITYEVETNLPGLDCEGTGTGTNEVQLTNDRYTVYCVQDTQGQNEFERPATITLSYDYLERIKKTVQVEHISQ